MTDKNNIYRTWEGGSLAAKDVWNVIEQSPHPLSFTQTFGMFPHVPSDVVNELMVDLQLMGRIRAKDADNDDDPPTRFIALPWGETVTKI